MRPLGMQPSERPLERLVRRKIQFGFIYVYHSGFASVRRRHKARWAEAQRRTFGGDSIFVLSPPNATAHREPGLLAVEPLVRL